MTVAYIEGVDVVTVVNQLLSPFHVGPLFQAHQSQSAWIVRGLASRPTAHITRKVCSRIQRLQESCDDQKLVKSFQNRFSFRITAAFPTLDDLVLWLANLRQDWGTPVEAPETALPRLVERYYQIPWMALQVLNPAHNRRTMLLRTVMAGDRTCDFGE